MKSPLHSIRTVLHGLSLTWQHLLAARKGRQIQSVKSDNYFAQKEGINTIQYPREKLPVAEVGRYQLDVEMDDCIVCDLCAKVCPVDCIEIDAIKATGPIGQTSDGTTKRLYAERFEIDMAKCMYCGLCTTVCPTECIVMTNQYDKSVPDIAQLNYTFAQMPADEAAEKKQALEQQQAEKQAAKMAAMQQKKDG